MMVTYMKMSSAMGFVTDGMFMGVNEHSVQRYTDRYSEDIMDQTIDEYMDENNFFRYDIKRKSLELRYDGSILDQLLEGVLVYKPHYVKMIKEHGDEYERFKIHRRASK